MQTWWRKVNQSGWWQAVKLARARWAAVDGDQRAAAFAYYLLLSLLPLVIMLVSAGSLFVERDIATREVVEWVNYLVTGLRRAGFAGGWLG